MSERDRFEAWANRNFHGVAALTECHCGEDGYYNRAQVAEMAWQAARADALEQAAKVCEERANRLRERVPSYATGAAECAAAIRALLPQEGK